MTLAQRVGANIKAARKARGRSLEKLAARIRPEPTSYQHLSRLEKGGDALNLDWVERIADALGVDPISLIVGPEAPSLSVPLLSEQAATEYARTLATVALKVPDPDEGTVELVALALQGLLRTISRNPGAATDATLARIAADAVGSQYVPVAN
jgi:transcriptional regulator with XRE-family HTH domain